MKAFAGVAFALLFVYGIFSSAGGRGMRYSPRDLFPYRSATQLPLLLLHNTKRN